MSNLEKIRHYYEIGIYTERHLKALLKAGALSAEEYEKIIGEEQEE